MERTYDPKEDVGCRKIGFTGYSRYYRKDTTNDIAHSNFQINGRYIWLSIYPYSKNTEERIQRGRSSR
jgi:hypothetical protein